MTTPKPSATPSVKEALEALRRIEGNALDGQYRNRDFATIRACLGAQAAGQKALDARRREGRQLLRRMVKLAREPVVSAGFTRLERVIVQVDDYLNRTADPKDLLR